MKRIICFLLLCSLILTVNGCSAPRKESLSTNGIYFDTIVTIEIWGGTEDILNNCLELCEYYEQLLSRTIETSEISRINSAGGQPVTVSAETAKLIEKALSYCELSGGSFDITIAPLSTLWNFRDNESKLIPSQEAIDQAVSHVNYQNVIIRDNTVTLLDPEAAIDLGAIAKGYIADQLKSYLLSEGIEHALINLGGNVLAIGTKLDNTPFRIGIQKPFDKNGQPITSVEINNQSVVSSGNYERYFIKDDKIYHHILNPKTGYPYENNLLQVTIISDSSTDGDALSTTCFALGLEAATHLIKQQKDVTAIFVTTDYTLHQVN